MAGSAGSAATCWKLTWADVRASMMGLNRRNTPEEISLCLMCLAMRMQSGCRDETVMPPVVLTLIDLSVLLLSLSSGFKVAMSLLDTWTIQRARVVRILLVGKIKSCVYATVVDQFCALRRNRDPQNLWVQTVIS